MPCISLCEPPPKKGAKEPADHGEDSQVACGKKKAGIFFHVKKGMKALKNLMPLWNLPDKKKNTMPQEEREVPCDGGGEKLGEARKL